MAEKEIAIELKGIRKTFGSVVANDSVNLQVKRGEILALLGENGSGKTTLMNMLSGIYKPDSGTISVGGQVVSIQSPEDSKNLRIGMVHQHFKLVSNYTITENIILGMEPQKKLFGFLPSVDIKNTDKKIAELSKKILTILKGYFAVMRN